MGEERGKPKDPNPPKPQKPFVANPSTPGIQNPNRPDGRDAPQEAEKRG